MYFVTFVVRRLHRAVLLWVSDWMAITVNETDLHLPPACWNGNRCWSWHPLVCCCCCSCCIWSILTLPCTPFHGIHGILGISAWHRSLTQRFNPRRNWAGPVDLPAGLPGGSHQVFGECGSILARLGGLTFAGISKKISICSSFPLSRHPPSLMRWKRSWHKMRHETDSTWYAQHVVTWQWQNSHFMSTPYRNAIACGELAQDMVRSLMGNVLVKNLKRLKWMPWLWLTSSNSCQTKWK